MSAFYVGQRVRAVVAPSPVSHLLGREGVIVEQHPYAAGWMFDWEVDFGNIIGRWCCNSDKIEPITPPHQLADADFAEQFDAQFREVFAPERVS